MSSILNFAYVDSKVCSDMVSQKTLLKEGLTFQPSMSKVYD